MWTRSEAAFRFSADRLFDLYSPVYFWTFTMTQVQCDWCYSEIWGRFVRDLSDLYGGTLHGLKVTELHKEHGLHFHALVNKRIWQGEVRRIGKRYGVGWVSVKRADYGSVDYLAKYLFKGVAAGASAFRQSLQVGDNRRLSGLPVQPGRNRLTVSPGIEDMPGGAR